MKQLKMIRPTCLLVMTLGIMAMANSADAQGGGSRGNAARARIQRPTVSPYLNLYRQDTEDLPTYQTLVRPQVQQQRVNQVQQSELTQLRSQLATEQARQQQPLPTTGHVSYFRHYSHYFSRKK
ncbi:MAG: hypothetical protein SGJ19_02810 [Planctomycetia bacterium]|nr:hypothetical protein [Planctomycetia bacterium]